MREDELAWSSVAIAPMYVVSLRGCEDSIFLLINYNPLSTFCIRANRPVYLVPALASCYPEL